MTMMIKKLIGALALLLLVSGAAVAQPIQQLPSYNILGRLGTAGSAVAVPMATLPALPLYTPPGTGGVSVSQNDFNDRVVYIADYATCDGVTVNVGGIQNAYNAANGGRLVFPKNAVCLSSTTLTANIAGTYIDGQNATLKITTAAGDALNLAQSNQTVANLNVTSSIAAASRTGNGIAISFCLSCLLQRVGVVGHNFGIYGTNAPATILHYVSSTNNKSHGIVFDAWVGGANSGNIDELGLYQVNSNVNGVGGSASGIYINGGTHSIGISMVRPTAANNTGSGITLNNPDGAGGHAVRDVWITQPEMSANGGGNAAIGQIDASGNTGALSLTVDGGGLIECASLSGYGIHAGTTQTLQIGNVPILQCLTAGILANGTGGNIAGTTLAANAVQLELGPTSSGYVLSGIQGQAAPWGSSATGLKIDVGAGSFVCTGVDFGTSTTPLSGTIPAGSVLLACPSKTVGFVQSGVIAAPATPSSGFGTAWFDSTDLRLHDKGAAGTIGTTVVADAGAANNFLTAVSAAGVISKAQPSVSNLSGFGTGVATALGINVGTAGAFVVNGGALGTPSSGTLTNATGCTISGCVSGLGTSVATALGTNVGSAGAFVVNGGALGSPSSAGTLPAHTLGGTVSGGGNQINNVVIGASTPLTGSFTILGASGIFTSTNSTASTSTATGAIVTSGGVGASGDVNWGGSAWTTFTPTVTAAAGTFMTVSATGKWKAFGKLIAGYVAITCTDIGSATTRMIVDMPTNHFGTLASVGNGINLTSSKMTNAVNFDNLNKFSVINFDGTFPCANTQVVYLSFFYQGA